MQPSSLIADPEMLGQTPRRAGFTSSAIALRRFLLLLLITGPMIYVFYATQDMRQIQALRYHGLAVQATVTSKHISHGKSDSYYLDYEYVQGSTMISDDDNVGESVYEQTNVGDPLTITYLPSDTSVYCAGVVTDDRVSGRETNWVLWGIILVALLAAIFFGVVNAQKNQLFLLTYGSPATAMVTDRRVIKGKTVTYRLMYQFEVNGQLYPKSIQVTSSIYNLALPQSPLTVLYDPQNPANCSPFFALTSVYIS